MAWRDISSLLSGRFSLARAGGFAFDCRFHAIYAYRFVPEYTCTDILTYLLEIEYALIS